MILRTSEWVSPGHPDKVADRISEYILDKLLAVDPDTRFALEVQIKGNQVSLAGEITTKADVVEGDYQHWAKEAVNAIGYTKEYQHKWGVENTICGDDLIVLCNIQQQSPDIACGVNNDGWGDQGIFTGYAEISNDHYMPLDKDLAREIGLKLYNNAYMYNVGGLDIKTQITLDKDKIKQLVVAIPVMDDLELEEIRSMISFWLEVEKGINYLEDDDIIVNGTGIYKQHGPIADCGTTGRKLAVDFYGNNAPIGGGSPWTKDGTKADLSLNLFARENAVKDLIRYTQTDDEYDGAEIYYAICQLCCCIGQSRIYETMKFYTKDGYLIDAKSTDYIVKPSEVIERYHLKEPIYFNLCKNGLFESDMIWNHE